VLHYITYLLTYLLTTLHQIPQLDLSGRGKAFKEVRGGGGERIHRERKGRGTREKESEG